MKKPFEIEILCFFNAFADIKYLTNKTVNDVSSAQLKNAYHGYQTTKLFFITILSNLVFNSLIASINNALMLP